MGNKNIANCIVCGEETSYTPEFCCDGRECGCMGRPIEPPLCSKECEEAIFGGSFEEEMKREKEAHDKELSEMLDADLAESVSRAQLEHSRRH